MNHIFSLVWNRALRSVQVASENAHSHGGDARAANTAALRRHPLALACAAAIALGAFAAPAWSAPTLCSPGGADSVSGMGQPGSLGAGGIGGHRGVGLVPSVYATGAYDCHSGQGGTTGSGFAVSNISADRQRGFSPAGAPAGGGNTFNIWAPNGAAYLGGSGTWTTTSATWTDTNHDPVQAMSPQPGFAIFGGSPSMVTVSDGNNGSAPVQVTGMQVVNDDAYPVDNFLLQGDPLTLVGTTSNGVTVAPVIRVGDGTAAGASALTAQINNVLQGSDGLTKTDFGQLILTAANTFTGGVTVNGGTLSISAADNLGAAANALTLDGGTLESTASFTLGNAVTLGNAGGAFNTDGTPNGSTTLTLSGLVSGAGALTKAGSGTLTISHSNDTWSGGTTINAGTLKIGTGAGTSGSIGSDGSIVNIGADGTLEIDVSGYSTTYQFGGTGNIVLDQNATLLASGDSSAFAGTTTVDGSLFLMAPLGGNVVVAPTGWLLGATTIGGNVDAQSGARVEGGGGSDSGTLTIDGNLTLAAGAELMYTLGAPGATSSTPGSAGHLDVNGQMTFDGTANLYLQNYQNLAGPGLYNLASYGSLAMTNCAIGGGGTQCLAYGTLPTGYSANQLTLVNNTQGKQIDLYIGAVPNGGGGTPVTLNIWAPNGTTTLGGNGTWSTTSATWTDPNKDTPAAMSPQPGFAIFQGTPGTVSIDDGSNGANAVTATGLQFAVNGYTLTGLTPNDGLTLVGTPNGSTTTAPIIEVGDGSSASAGMTATISTPIATEDGFTKTGAGTLVFAGPTGLASQINVQSLDGVPITVAVQGGTLQVGGSAVTSSTPVDAVVAASVVMSAGTKLVLQNGGVVNLGPASAAVTGNGFDLTTNPVGTGVSAIEGFATTTNGGSAIAGDGFNATFNGRTLILGAGVGSFEPGSGAAAITGADFTVTNNSAMGAYSTGGGAGVALPYGITGGTGTYTRTSTAAGTGGAGITGTGFTVTNNGGVFGGVGGQLVAGATGAAGAGGAGVAGTGFTLTNTGTVTGGAGSAYYDATSNPSYGTHAVIGQGGAGVSSLGGATVINEGTISGGKSGAGLAIGDAIDFTGGGNTLELVAGHPGTFNGAIVATRVAGNAADTLALGGDSGSDTFDLSQLASGGVYGGFNAGSKVGNSTWTLEGTDADTATFAVKAGTLVVGDDSHGSTTLGADVTVANGATISGIGTVGGLDLFGTLSPGGSIGTFHVAGDATFETGSTFNVEADADGSADLLAASGKVTIKGGNTVVISQAGNWALGTTYTIITAGKGVTGMFDGVTDNQVFLLPTLTYDPNDVKLTLTRNNLNFNGVAATPNQKDAATGIEGIGYGTPLYDAVVLLTADQARAAFDQTSGEFDASQQTARINDSRYIREAMNERLRAGDNDPSAAKQGDSNVTAWAHAWGHWGTVDGDGNAAGLADNGDGLLIGADTPLGNQARIGITGGASRNSLSVNDRASWGRQTSTWLGGFAGYDAGAFGLRGGIAYAWDQIPTDREVNFPGFTDRLSGNATGDTLTGFVEGSWTFHFSGATVTPFLNLAHTKVETDASTEAGGAAALIASQHSENVSFSTLGARGQIDFAHNLNLHGELGWQHAYGDVTPDRSMQFVAGGPSFTEYGVPVAKNAGLGRIGLGWHQGNVAIDANYEGLAGNGVKDQAAKLSVSVTF